MIEKSLRRHSGGKLGLLQEPMTQLQHRPNSIQILLNLTNRIDEAVSTHAILPRNAKELDDTRALQSTHSLGCCEPSPVFLTTSKPKPPKPLWQALQAAQKPCLSGTRRIKQRRWKGIRRIQRSLEAKPGGPAGAQRETAKGKGDET